MAFQQSAVPRQIPQSNLRSSGTSSSHNQAQNNEQSQAWILFSPSHAESSTNRTGTSQTAGLSRISDLGSLNTAARSGQPQSSVLEEEATEDGELDSLDDGLHAFREPVLYHTTSHQTGGAVLPAHDGLGTFPASSPLVLEQLWQHEQHNPKRKHEGVHRRTSSIQRRLDTIEELEAQASEEKRLRIEKWRLEQSEALIEEVRKETRRHLKKEEMTRPEVSTEEIFGTTPTQADYLTRPAEDSNDGEPFWRRITRKFIRDIIGIDEPLLSVILGESLPEDIGISPTTANSPDDSSIEAGWRDKLLQRIARELGVFVHQLSPHPGAFTTYQATEDTPDYAGIPIRSEQPTSKEIINNLASNSLAPIVGPEFSPTLGDQAHAESWGVEEEPVPSMTDSQLNLQKEREYWERELDVKMVFRYLRNRFIPSFRKPDPPPMTAPSTYDASASRAAIIRQHHPLVARAHRSPARLRRDSSRLSVKRPSSSCASESVKSGRKASRSSSRNYWDIGGSVGSGSLLASGAFMGAWGEV